MDLKGVRGDVTIENCQISNERSSGIIFEGTSGATTIQDCQVHGCRYNGLCMHVAEGRAAHRGNVLAIGCTFEENGYDGIYLGDSRCEFTTQRCRVTGNKRHGVFVRGVACDLQECHIEGNGGEGVHREEASSPASAALSPLKCVCGYTFRSAQAAFCAWCGIPRTHPPSMQQAPPGKEDSRTEFLEERVEECAALEGALLRKAETR